MDLSVGEVVADTLHELLCVLLRPLEDSGEEGQPVCLNAGHSNLQEDLSNLLESWVLGPVSNWGLDDSLLDVGESGILQVGFQLSGDVHIGASNLTGLNDMLGVDLDSGVQMGTVVTERLSDGGFLPLNISTWDQVPIFPLGHAVSRISSHRLTRSTCWRGLASFAPHRSIHEHECSRNPCCRSTPARNRRPRTSHLVGPKMAGLEKGRYRGFRRLGTSHPYRQPKHLFFYQQRFLDMPSPSMLLPVPVPRSKMRFNGLSEIGARCNSPLKMRLYM